MGLQTSENTFGAADKFTRAGNLDYNTRAEGAVKIVPDLAALNTWVAEEQARQRLGAGFGVALVTEEIRVATEPPGFRRVVTITNPATNTAVVGARTITMPNGSPPRILANTTNQVWPVTGTPTVGTGIDGDLAYRAATGQLWTKASGAWGTPERLLYLDDFVSTTPGRHVRIPIGMGATTTTTAAVALAGTVGVTLNPALVHSYGFVARLHAVRDGKINGAPDLNFAEAGWRLEGNFFWDGPGATGRIVANGATSSGANPTANLLEISNDLAIVTPPAFRISTALPRFVVTPLDAISIRWTGYIELLGGSW